jgi:hypothetical protein
VLRKRKDIQRLGAEGTVIRMMERRPSYLEGSEADNW